MTLHRGIDGSVPTAPVSAGYSFLFPGRNLEVRTVAPGRSSRHMREPIEGERTDRTPNTVVPV